VYNHNQDVIFPTEELVANACTWYVPALLVVNVYQTLLFGVVQLLMLVGSLGFVVAAVVFTQLIFGSFTIRLVGAQKSSLAGGITNCISNEPWAVLNPYTRT
jgi:hypothetical protein